MSGLTEKEVLGVVLNAHLQMRGWKVRSVFCSSADLCSACRFSRLARCSQINTALLYNHSAVARREEHGLKRA